MFPQRVARYRKGHRPGCGSNRQDGRRQGPGQQAQARSRGQMLTQDFSFVQKEIESQAQIITAEAGAKAGSSATGVPS